MSIESMNYKLMIVIAVSSFSLIYPYLLLRMIIRFQATSYVIPYFIKWLSLNREVIFKG
ncbi:hypothetical protein NEOC65_002281 [Neochlamydia sp. AcF65]|nr:hypothetical protein [Neochlamydia sp. AcF65]